MRLRNDEKAICDKGSTFCLLASLPSTRRRRKSGSNRCRTFRSRRARSGNASPTSNIPLKLKNNFLVSFTITILDEKTCLGNATTMDTDGQWLDVTRFGEISTLW